MILQFLTEMVRAAPFRKDLSPRFRPYYIQGNMAIIKVRCLQLAAANLILLHGLAVNSVRM